MTFLIHWYSISSPISSAAAKTDCGRWSRIILLTIFQDSEKETCMSSYRSRMRSLPLVVGWVSLPSVILLPNLLGIFGVALQYHRHYMVLALGVFLITFSAMLSVPVTVNYVMECFRQHALEASAIMGVYHLAFASSARGKRQLVQHTGWVFGMAGFF